MQLHKRRGIFFCFITPYKKVRFTGALPAGFFSDPRNAQTISPPFPPWLVAKAINSETFYVCAFQKHSLSIRRLCNLTHSATWDQQADMSKEYQPSWNCCQNGSFFGTEMPGSGVRNSSTLSCLFLGRFLGPILDEKHMSQKLAKNQPITVKFESTSSNGDNSIGDCAKGMPTFMSFVQSRPPKKARPSLNGNPKCRVVSWFHGPSIAGQRRPAPNSFTQKLKPGMVEEGLRAEANAKRPPPDQVCAADWHPICAGSQPHNHLLTS